MGKCINCGRKGLFLYVNKDGMCKDCESKVRIKEQRLIREQQMAELKKAEEFFDTLIEMYSNITVGIEVSRDPMDRLEDIPLVEAKIKLCDEFISLLPKYTQYKKFASVFDQNLVYDSDFDKRRKFGRIKKLSIVVWADKPNYLNTAMDDLATDIKRKQRLWENVIHRIKSDASFQETLISLKSFSITKDDNPVVNNNNISDMPVIKYTNITSKTNYEKLGTFVVIDTETTGLNCGQNEIIEVAAICFENWVPVLKFESLIKPRRSIPQNISKLTGINDEMVAQSPRIESIILSLTEFIGKHNLVGHNLPFDLKFLFKNGLDFFLVKRKYYDTLEIAQKLLKKPSYKWDKDLETYEVDDEKEYDVENHKLDTLCEYYEIRNNDFGHRALSDCLATGILFKELTLEKLL